MINILERIEAMKADKDNLVKEYDMLRSEINQKIELHNTLLTFTITTTVAVLTFALSKNMTVLYLIPFCIIIPMSMRIAYYRSAITKLAAYMIVFLERNLDEIKWETRNAMLIENVLSKENKSINNITILRYYECLIMAVICYAFYVLDYIKDKDISIILIINILWPLLLIVWEILITKRINSAAKEKQEWIKKWTYLKDKIEKTYSE